MGTSPKLHPGPQSAPSGSLREGPKKCCHRRRASSRRVLADRRRPGRDAASLNLRPRLRGTPPFTTIQFHVLLNSLFKVLFNFPSRYLFAIGLGVIFSLMRSLPHALSCTPKQLDSRERSQRNRAAALRAYHPLRAVAPVKVDLDWPLGHEETLPNTTCRATERVGSSVLGSARFIRHY